jgi:hypothetical protein
VATFIQRSAAFGSGSTVPAHGSAVVGDKQILGVVTHATITPGTPTGGDWTQLSQTNSAHSKLTIFSRTLTAGNISGTVSVTWASIGRVEMRTYRDVNAFTVAGNGTGLVSPSRTASGILLRFVASAENNNSSFPPIKTLTADAALLNKSPAALYDWYDGLVVGDDPTASGSTAPTRTATNTGGGDTYPQWVDVNVEPVTDRRAAGVGAEALIQSDAPERRAAGLTAEALMQSDNIQRNTAGVIVEILVKVPRPFIGWGNPVM